GSRDDRGRRHPRAADVPDWRRVGVSRLEEVGFWFAQAAIFFSLLAVGGVFWVVVVALLVEEVLELNQLISTIAVTTIPAVLSLGTGIAVLDRVEKRYHSRRLLPLIRRCRLCA